jgi:hypothetical protein
VNFWKENPVFRGVVYALGVMALIAFFVHLRRPNTPPPGSSAENDRPSAAASPLPINKSAGPPHINSNAIFARCQPELKEVPSVPTFEIGENYNRVAVQLTARFLVDNNGFAMNAYVTGATVVSPQDQEAAIDYIRHLTFQAPSAEECETIKVPMVGNFHMSKSSNGDWTTVFDVHPVYSFNGSQVVAN